MGGDDGCTFRVTTATLSSAVLGGAAGATYASFRDVPRVLRSQAMPALVATMGVTGSFAGTFAVVGLAYSGVECAAEGVRGKKDFWNGAFGGAAAGAVLGVRAGRAGTGVGAAVALAAMSALVDSSGQKLRVISREDLPQRRLHPYPDAE